MGKIILSGCFILNDSKEILLLYRRDHHHYETPGGKVDASDALDPEHPTRAELQKTATREVFEELGRAITLAPLSYFGSCPFTLPDGREAVAHKFITTILSGSPRINEPQIFTKLVYLPVLSLQQYQISPDLRLFLDRLKDHVANVMR